MAKVIIHVSEGVVTEVYSDDEKLFVAVLDEDNLDCCDDEEQEEEMREDFRQLRKESDSMHCVFSR